MEILKQLEETINQLKEKDSAYARRMIAEEKAHAKLMEQHPSIAPELYSLGKASINDYVNWLFSYLINGGKVTHVYDYEFSRWAWYIAKKDFDLPAFFGSSSVNIIIPIGVNAGTPKGHNSYYWQESGNTNGIVPMFEDVYPLIEKKLKESGE